LSKGVISGLGKSNWVPEMEKKDYAKRGGVDGASDRGETPGLIPSFPGGEKTRNQTGTKNKTKKKTATGYVTALRGRLKLKGVGKDISRMKRENGWTL